MCLDKLLANSIVDYFKRLKVGDNIKINPNNENKIRFLDFDFEIYTKGNNLEILITPPKENNGFDKYFSEIQEKDFLEKRKLYKILKYQKKHKKTLQNRRFLSSNKGYTFDAEINSKDNNAITESIINFLIRPVVLYQRIKENNP